MSIHDAGLQKLLREPARLRGEAERINAEMETLVSQNYRVFVENLTCSVHLQKEDKKLQDLFIGLAGHIEQLNGNCGEFKDLVQEFVQAHKRIRRTLQCHLQLLELLEVPQLVESCSRYGALDEALELASFVRSLERRHNVHNHSNNINCNASQNSVIQSIASDVSASLLHMRRQLLQQLSSSVSISKQVYVVATLRKIDGILMPLETGLCSAETAEARRMMDYLEARSFFIVQTSFNNATINSNNNNASVESVGRSELPRPTGDSLGPYGKAVELLENRRTSLYTVMNQFRSLFSDIEPEIAEEILRKWISHHVLLILRELSSYLNEIQDGVAIKALLEQAVYFAKRLADEGGDFTAAVLRLFARCVGDVVVRHCFSATKSLQDTLNQSEMTVAYDTSSFSLYAPMNQFVSLTQLDTNSDMPGFSSSSTGVVGDILPPVILLSFPPLCHHLNMTLNALNFLRACPLLSVYEDIYGVFVKLGWDCIACITDKSSFLRSVSNKLLVSLSSDGGKGTKAKQINKENAPNPSGNSSSQRLDELYAEAVAFHLLPHIFITLSLIFRKIDSSAAHDVYDSYKKSMKNNQVARLLSTASECEALFGIGATTNILQSYWKKFAELKLIDFSSEK